MSKTNLTILDPVAYAEHLAEKNRAATAELQTLLESPPVVSSSSPTPSQTNSINWLSFVIVAVIAMSFGLFAGAALMGGIF